MSKFNKYEFIYKDEYTDGDGVLHYVIRKKPVYRICPACGSEWVVLNEYKELKLTDLGENGEKVIYDITQPRYRCRNCGKTYQQKVDGRYGAFTGSFIRYIVSQILNNREQIKDVSEKYVMPFSTARKIVAEEIGRRRERKSYRMPERLLLDRLYLKGYPVFLLVDLQEMKLLDILEENEL